MKSPLHSLCFFLALALPLSLALASPLTLRQDPDTKAISVFRDGTSQPILTQNAGADFY